MQFSRSLKNLSLGLAIISMSAMAASAQSLSGVNTRLLKPIDSQTAKQGDAVTVRLDGNVTADGVKLPKGAQLIGKIADVKASPAKGSPASVTVVFTSAQLKDGKQIPIKATLVAAYPATAVEDLSTSAVPAPDSVPEAFKVDQQPGALPGIALKAAVKDPDSGTFTKQNGNFTLKAGTHLQLAVAPAAGASTTNAAE
jgi:hypothetical protein